MGENAVDKIYQSFDYDFGMNFSRLTSEEYMQCYVQMKKAFEVDLANNPIYCGYSEEWAVKDWYDEIKVQMQSAPLFNNALIDNK